MSPIASHPATATARPQNPVILIPARLASTRLPGKPLADIHGLPMIVHVWRRAMEAELGPVYVACAEAEILAAVEAAGGQAVQMAAFIEETHDPALVGIVAGDFNERPGSFVYEQFVGRGWRDAYLVAGNPECDPATGVGCTSGREDEGLSGLESPASGETARIDFVFVIPPADPPACAAAILPPGDDGSGTRLFADQSNPFAPSCGPAPQAICWPSDHVGVQLALACG